MRGRTGSRRSSRELALRALYQTDLAEATPEEAFASASEEHERYSEETLNFGRELLLGVTQHAGTIDAVIEKYARGWSLERMAHLDRNIMRLATYELLYLPDIPPSVTVDEAVELAKRYSTAESGRFVNGVLGNIVRNLEEERSQI
ncbi:MAG: transcription antitermination factor NusB [Armatimonadetes bacterium]|nr:transcription antitermination factor NusB [Armatimonadota bacterium]